MGFTSKFFDETINNFKLTDSLLNGFTIVGIGSLVYNGLSYSPIECCTSILCFSEEDHGWHSGIFRYIYLPDYDKSVGYEENSSIPSPERAICDYLLYPTILPKAEVYSAIQLYEEDEELGDTSKIVETGVKLGLPKQSIIDLIEEAESLFY